MNPCEMKAFILYPNNAFKIGAWASAQQEYRPSTSEKGYGLDGRKPKAPTYGEYQDR